MASLRYPFCVFLLYSKQFVYLDLSPTSLAISKARAELSGCANVNWFQVEEVLRNRFLQIYILQELWFDLYRIASRTCPDSIWVFSTS